MTPHWSRFVALGDAITEGFGDPATSSGTGTPWLGWAGRLAAILDGNARLRATDFGFANLGYHGHRVRHVVEEQIPRAIGLHADLVSILVGSDDLVRPRSDPDALADDVATGVAALRRAGCDVLLATCFDPRLAFVPTALRRRAAAYNANLWSIARAHGTFALDLWGVRELRAREMWADDRTQLAPAGHRLLAVRAAQALSIPYFELAARAPEAIADA